MPYPKDMAHWSESVTPEEWAEWIAFAEQVARKQEKRPTSLGFEDYAQQALEKLFQQPNRPDNIKGWLTTVVKNAYIDRFRKISARGGESLKALTDDEWEHEMVAFAVASPSALALDQKVIMGILESFSPREKELLLYATAGYKNNEIAEILDYKNGKIVATRIAQIMEKVKNKLHQS